MSTDIKRNKQHRSGKKGVLDFDASLPSNEIIDFLFTETPQQSDYGLDGFLQVFSKEVNTGEIYWVQIKRQEKINVKKSGTISYKIPLKTAKFLLDTTTEPVVLVLCSKDKVFWHDIQTNSSTIKTYREAIDSGASSLTLEIDPILTLPETHEEFYKYLRNALAIKGKSLELKRLSNLNLVSSIAEIKNLSNQASSLKGYDVFKKGDLENVKHRVVFSIVDGKTGEETHFVPNDSFTPDDLIKIDTQFSFPNTEEGKTKFEELKDVMEGRKDSIDLSGSYIKSLRSSSGNRTIDEISSPDENFHLRIGKPTSELDLYIKSLNNDEEVKIKVELWNPSGSLMVTDSSRFNNQPMAVKFTFDLSTGAGTYNISTTNNITNVSDAVFYEEFLLDLLTTGASLHTYIGGIKRQLLTFSSAIDEDRQNESKFRIEFFKKLALIQEKTSTVFPFPLASVSNNEINNIHMLYELLKNGKFKTSLTLSFSIDKEITESGFIVFNTPLNLDLLGAKISLPDHQIEIKGKIDQLEKENNQYKVILNEAEINLLKTTQT